MREFKFAPIEGQGRPTTGEVTLTQHRVTLGVRLYEGMGEPPRIIVSYDPRGKALKLEPRFNEGMNSLKVIHSSRFRVSLGVMNIGSVMPIGRYLPIGSDIFIHESLQR